MGGESSSQSLPPQVVNLDGPAPSTNSDVLTQIRIELHQLRQAVTGMEELKATVRRLSTESANLRFRLRRLSAIAAPFIPPAEQERFLVEPAQDMHYADIKDFILVGGPQDPLSLRYEVQIRDSNGLVHKSAERYLWYKMAETFDDTEAMEKILKADSGVLAENTKTRIKNFESTKWERVKLIHWEEGQRLKMEQTPWIRRLLVYSNPIYIAVASSDKLWGTGWRKMRAEAGQPRQWDGENMGGKALMRIRQSFADDHIWVDDEEKKCLFVVVVSAVFVALDGEGLDEAEEAAFRFPEMRTIH